MWGFGKKKEDAPPSSGGSGSGVEMRHNPLRPVLKTTSSLSMPAAPAGSSPASTAASVSSSPSPSMAASPVASPGTPNLSAATPATDAEFDEAAFQNALVRRGGVGDGSRWPPRADVPDANRWDDCVLD